MLYVLAVVLVLLCAVICGQKIHSLAQKKKIESLESNLERSRNSLEVYEQQQSELQHRLTSLRIELGTLRQRNETMLLNGTTKLNCLLRRSNLMLNKCSNNVGSALKKYITS